MFCGLKKFSEASWYFMVIVCFFLLFPYLFRKSVLKELWKFMVIDLQPFLMIEKSQVDGC